MRAAFLNLWKEMKLQKRVKNVDPERSFIDKLLRHRHRDRASKLDAKESAPFPGFGRLKIILLS